MKKLYISSFIKQFHYNTTRERVG